MQEQEKFNGRFEELQDWKFMTICTLGKDNFAKTLVLICITTAKDLFPCVPSVVGLVLGTQLQEKIKQ